MNMTKSAFTYSGFNPHRSSSVTQSVQSVGFEKQFANLFGFFITGLCYLCVALTAPVSCLICLKVVKEGEELLISRLGKLLQPRKSGLAVVLPCIDKWVRIDLRRHAFNVPPKQVFTHDGAVIELGAEVFFHVSDSVKVFRDIHDLNATLRAVTQSCVFNYISQLKLSELELRISQINRDLEISVNTILVNWGVKATRISVATPKILQPPGFVDSQLYPSHLQLSNTVHSIFRSLGQAYSNDHHLLVLNDSKQLLSTPSCGSDVSSSLTYETDTNAVPVSSGDGHDQSSIYHDVQLPRLSLEDLMQRLRPHITAELARDFGIVYKFVISGDDTFYLDLKNAPGSIFNSKNLSCSTFSSLQDLEAAVDVTVTTSSDCAALLLSGKLRPFTAYMSGDIEVSGDLRSAARLEELTSFIS